MSNNSDYDDYDAFLDGDDRPSPHEEREPARRSPNFSSGPKVLSTPWTGQIEQDWGQSRHAQSHTSQLDMKRSTYRAVSASPSFWNTLKRAFTGGPHPEEIARREYEEAMQRQFDYNLKRIGRNPNGHTVLFLTLKGGGTKTANCLGVGNAFGVYSRYGVLAADFNSDTGTMGLINGIQNDADILDLYENLPNVRSYSDFTKFTNSSPRSYLDVLNSRERSERSVTPQHYREIMEVAHKFWPLVLNDSGIDFTQDTNPIMKSMIAEADTIVICSTTKYEYRDMAERTISRIRDMGYGYKLDKAIVSIVYTSKIAVNEAAIRAEFTAKGVGRTVFIPFDSYLGHPETRFFLWDELDLDTQMAWMNLGAEISDNFKTVR